MRKPLSSLFPMLYWLCSASFQIHAAPPTSSDGVLQNYFLTVTRNLLATNAFTFDSEGLKGRTGYRPGTSYQHEYLRDFLFAVHAAPSLFPARELRWRIEWYAAHTRTNAITDAIGYWPRGGPSYDSQYDFVDLVYQHYRISGSYREFTNFQAAISKALDTVQVRHHLVWLTNGMIGWGFNDALKKNGYECMSSLLRYRTCQQMGEMTAAAGQAANSAVWFSELPLIRESLRSNLWDSSTGLYFDNSGARLHNIPASAYAIAVGACDEVTAQTISRKLAAGLPGGLDVLAGKGFSDNGAIRMFPLNESPAGDYQAGGYWPAFSGWVASAVDLTDGQKSQQLLSSLAASLAFPGTTLCAFEWFNSSTKQGAHNAYIASAAGPALFVPRAARLNPSARDAWAGISNIVLAGGSINATPFATQLVEPVRLFTCYTNQNRRAIATVRFAFDAAKATQNPSGDFSFSVQTFQPGGNLTNVWEHEWINNDSRQKFSTPITFWLSPGEVYVFNCQPREENAHAFDHFRLMLGYE